VSSDTEGGSMESLTSTELCERSGISRDNLNFWTQKLGIEPVGSRIERNTRLLLWDAKAARRLSRAYAKRRIRAKRNGG
jgi:hypothetical protein